MLLKTNSIGAGFLSFSGKINYDINILRNNPDIKQASEWLNRYYGFTQEHIAREFQIAAAEYREERAERQKEEARRKASDRELERLYDEWRWSVGDRSGYNPYRAEPEGDAHEEYK